MALKKDIAYPIKQARESGLPQTLYQSQDGQHHVVVESVRVPSTTKDGAHIPEQQVTVVSHLVVGEHEGRRVWRSTLESALELGQSIMHEATPQMLDERR